MGEFWTILGKQKFYEPTRVTDDEDEIDDLVVVFDDDDTDID